MRSSWIDGTYWQEENLLISETLSPRFGLAFGTGEVYPV